ncbi:MAG: histidyl-tRNA synthetase [Cyanobacteria bacterium RYN_339]|nr:histidyl-tRNA synthetase [Cyanobacteria bacterium RYN_339]
MSNHVTAPKGTKDILPADAGRWQHVEAMARELFKAYRYQEIRTPVFESTDLFQRGIGENTDIVGKEMYTFESKSDDPTKRLSLTLRPENTAGVVRAYIQHKLFAQPLPQKLWYTGPMFRYERPQAGRQRQFHQLGVEVLGSDDARWDAEVIVVATDFLARLGLPALEVQLNSVGDDACRPAYRDTLQAYLRSHQDALCENCRTRTEKNPLRVLDCKVPACQPVVQAAPTITENLCDGCRGHQAAVEGYLTAVGVAFKRNDRLVRGLDYYTRTVFEIVSGDLGAQNTVCAGGRYNGLVEELGGPSTPAVGWGLGLERLLMLLPADATPATGLTALIMATHGAAEPVAFRLAHDLRGQGLAIDLANGGKLDKQFKQAERLGARYAVILGEDELAKGVVSIKDLTTREQRSVPLDGVKDALKGAVAGGK